MFSLLSAEIEEIEILNLVWATTNVNILSAIMRASNKIRMSQRIVKVCLLPAAKEFLSKFLPMEENRASGRQP
jgi:hypothetical protein